MNLKFKNINFFVDNFTNYQIFKILFKIAFTLKNRIFGYFCLLNFHLWCGMFNPFYRNNGVYLNIVFLNIWKNMENIYPKFNINIYKKMKCV